MPPVRKKAIGKSGDRTACERKPETANSAGRINERNATRSPPENAGRKRGWRDIEAMSERARLKKLLTDIWHEDIELEDDIFGESDHMAGYYTDSDEEAEAADPEDDAEYEDFDEEED